MITTPVLLDLLANLLAATIYLAVARIVARRPVEPAGLAARTAFSGWWDVLGGLSVYGSIVDVATMAGFWESAVPLSQKVAFLVSVTHVVLLLILMAIAALFYYLVYLYTGRAGAWKPIFLVYGLFWAALVFWVESLHPNGLTQGTTTPQLAYEHDPTGTPASLVLGLLLLVPVIAAAIAYFTLFFKTREPTQRYRIAVVSLSIVIWFGFSLSGSLAGVQRAPLWLIVSRLVSLAGAAAVYLAYRPPDWVQRRWNVQATPR